MKTKSILPTPRISKLIALASLLMPIFAFAQEVDPNDYYYRSKNAAGTSVKNNPTKTGASAPWVLSDGSEITVAVNADTNLYFTKEAAPDINFFSVKKFNSLLVSEKGVGTTFNQNYNDKVKTYGDQVFSLNSTSKTAVSTGTKQGGLGGGTNGFEADGNMVLETEKYLNFVLRPNVTHDLNQVVTADRELGSSQIKVGKQLKMETLSDNALVRIVLAQEYEGGVWSKDGSLDDAYLIVNKTVKSDMILGGLTGSGVLSLSNYVSSEATVTFQKDESGVFSGGEWTGTNSIFSVKSYSATEDNGALNKTQKAANFYLEQAKTSTQKITYIMNSEDVDTKQTINLKSSATFHADTATEADISNINIENQTGYMVFNSDVKLNEVNVYDGKLELTANAGVNSLKLFAGKLDFTGSVETLTFDAGDGVSEFVYNGELDVQSLNIFASEIYVVFDKSDIEANNLISLITYDEIDADIDAIGSIFYAIDTEGNIIDGTFSIGQNATGDSALVFTAVPEPATIAGILGLIALAFAIRRRK